jgi:hypothetical protein
MFSIIQTLIVTPSLKGSFFLLADSTRYFLIRRVVMDFPVWNFVSERAEIKGEFSNNLYIDGIKWC